MMTSGLNPAFMQVGDHSGLVDGEVNTATGPA